MNILFLCVANSARSQMAEGLAKEILGEGHDIQSAGSEPSGKVHPGAIKSLFHIGLDISKNTSKSIDQLSQSFIEELDYVITLCKEEVCPLFISKAKRLHWPIEDPAISILNEEEVDLRFKIARDIIKTKINKFSITIHQ